jgi:hypothetical protein
MNYKVQSGYLWVLRFTNKTDSHDISEILLNVALNTIKQTNKSTNKVQKEPLDGYFDWQKDKKK